MTKQEYNKILKICKDIRKTKVKEYGYYDLRGWCYEVSEVLILRLYTELNLEANIIEGKCYNCFHYWVEYKGYIIDLTIKQFELQAMKELPEILIKPISKCKQYTNGVLV